MKMPSPCHLVTLLITSSLGLVFWYIYLDGLYPFRGVSSLDSALQEIGIGEEVYEFPDHSTREQHETGSLLKMHPSLPKIAFTCIQVQMAKKKKSLPAQEALILKKLLKVTLQAHRLRRNLGAATWYLRDRIIRSLRVSNER